MEEEIPGIRCHGGRPAHLACSTIESAENPVAETDEYEFSRDRGSVPKSAAAFEAPENDCSVRGIEFLPAGGGCRCGANDSTREKRYAGSVTHRAPPSLCGLRFAAV